MTGWSELGAAFALFLLAHGLPARPALRRRLVARLGEGLYLALYVVLSIGLLAWLVAAAGRAPYVALWDPATWQLWVPNLAMPLVCLLAAFGTAAPNPLSFGSRNDAAFDPERPGVSGVTRHPLLWALALWAGAHLAPNGDLAHVQLFGGFTLMAVAGMVALDRRRRSQLGDAEWCRLAARTSLLPLAALVTGRWRPRRLDLDPWRLLAALLVYVGLLWAHPMLIGVSPVPRL